MKKLLEKLKVELEKIDTNTKVNEAQTAAIKELTDYVNILIEEVSANNKTDKGILFDLNLSIKFLISNSL